MKYADALLLVLDEHVRSVQLHGTWYDYSVAQMMSVIINELVVEAGDAECRGDLDGEHGVIRELTQVASCCIKAIMVLSDRAEGHLAETLRTAGAHSEVEGREFPASPTLPQDKESRANHPEQGAQI